MSSNPNLHKYPPKYGRAWFAELRAILAEGYPAIPTRYTVFEKNSYYMAREGTTGKIEFGSSGNAGGIDGTDASAVVNAVLSNLTAGRTWQEKVVLKGDLDLQNISAIELVDNCIIEVQGRLKHPDVCNKPIFTTTGNISNTTIIGGRYKNHDWDVLVTGHTLTNCKFIDMDVDDVEIGFLFQASSVVNDCDFIRIKMANPAMTSSYGIEVLGGGTRNCFANIKLAAMPILLEAVTESLLYDVRSIGVASASQNPIALIDDSDGNTLIKCHGTDGKYGLYIKDSSYNTVLSGIFKNNAQYGIVVHKLLGTCTDNILRDAYLSGNTTAQIFDGGDNTKIRDLKGYKTVNLLTGKTVNQSETTIAHGLDTTPNNIQIINTSDGRIWRSAPSDATNIYLTADQNGRTCDIYVSLE